MREEAFLHAGHEDDRVFEALGGVQRHQRDAAAGGGDLIAIVDQCDPFEEFTETAGTVIVIERARRGEQLGDVLPARPRHRSSLRDAPRNRCAR